jgi:hypothetical protein
MSITAVPVIMTYVVMVRLGTGIIRLCLICIMYKGYRNIVSVKSGNVESPFS